MDIIPGGCARDDLRGFITFFFLSNSSASCDRACTIRLEDNDGGRDWQIAVDKLIMPIDDKYISIVQSMIAV